MITTSKNITPAVFNAPGYPVARGGKYVWPWGSGSGPGLINLYPQQIRNVFFENGAVQNILRRKFELVWGNGPGLYISRFSGGRRQQEWIRDKAVEEWLSGWDYREYLSRSLFEFLLQNGSFTRVHCDTKPGRFPAITHLEFVSCDLARYVWAGDDVEPGEILVGDFGGSALYRYTSYPVYDPGRIRFYREMVALDRLPQACLDDFYPQSPIHGTLSWIEAAGSCSRVLTAFNANSMALKYHISSPYIYWLKERERLKERCALMGTEYSERMLDDLKNEVFKEISDTLSGIGNSGKFIATEVVLDELRKRYLGWKITPLDHADIRSYFSAQTKISREATFNIASGLGLHPSISDITRAGGFSAGGQYEYSTKIFKFTATDIAEQIVTKRINDAISINFEGNKIKVGFDRDSV